MEGCFKILMDEIHKYEGTINQFTGDGVMALFGAPVSHEDHAQRACYAALSIQNSMNDYGEKIKGLTRFVGRKNSMATVMEAFDKAKSGSGRVLAIVGEAGVSKSRLLLEMKNKPYISRGYFYLGDLYNNMDRKDDAMRNLKIAKVFGYPHY